MSETIIRGSLIPEILQAVARLYDERIDPLCTRFIFDSKKWELRVVEDGKTEAAVTIPYLHSAMCYSGLTPWGKGFETKP